MKSTYLSSTRSPHFLNLKFPLSTACDAVSPLAVPRVLTAVLSCSTVSVGQKVFGLSAMNFGAKSKDLLVELKRSDWLPPYSEDGVRGVLAEIQALYEELTDTLGGRTTVRQSPGPSKLLLPLAVKSVRGRLSTRSVVSTRPPLSRRAVQSDIPDPVKVSLVVHHQALLRNKRCLLAYLKWRADRLGRFTH